MKTFSASAGPEPLSAETARGCAATNVALPGFGSLMAGRKVGYPQATLTVAGFILTMWFGVRFGIFVFKNWSALYGEQSDPLQTMVDVWLGARWSLLGMGLFAVSLLWALATNAEILRSAKARSETSKPPILN